MQESFKPPMNAIPLLTNSLSQTNKSFQHRPEYNTISRRSLKTSKIYNSKEFQGSGRPRKGHIQKFLVLTAQSLHTRNELGSPQNKKSKQQERIKSLTPSISTQVLRCTDENTKNKFQMTNSSSFYNKAFQSQASSMQQTYQMFMPNKIKKTWNFRANYDFVKPQMISKESPQNLQQILNKIRPSSQFTQNDIGSISHAIGENELKNDNHSFDITQDIEPFKIMSYDSQHAPSSPYIVDQTLTPALINKDSYNIGIIEEDKHEYNEVNGHCEFPQQQERVSTAQEQHNNQISVKSQLDRMMKKHQSTNNASKPQQLFIGQKMSQRDLIQKDENYMLQLKSISPYGDQHNLNDKVYNGGFLLKPRSKLQTYETQIRRSCQVHHPSFENKKITEKEKKEIIQVKSLNKIIKQRQQLLQKIKSEKQLNIDLEGDIYIHPRLTTKTNDNINKTLQYLQNLQMRPPSQSREFSPEQLSTPKMSSISLRPLTRSDQNHSPILFQNPIQKVLIKHKDPGVDQKEQKELPLIVNNTEFNLSPSKAKIIPNFHINIQSKHNKEDQEIYQPVLSKATLQYMNRAGLTQKDQAKPNIESYLAQKKFNRQKKSSKEAPLNDDILSGW